MSLLKPMSAKCEVCGGKLPRGELVIAFGNHRFCRTCYARVKPALKKAAYRSVRQKRVFDGNLLSTIFILFLVFGLLFLSTFIVMLTSGCINTGMSGWLEVRSFCSANGFPAAVNHGNSTDPVFYCSRPMSDGATVERRLAFLKNGSVTFALS